MKNKKKNLKLNIDTSLAEISEGNWGVYVKAASRLSFTLIDLSSQGERRNGMASLSLAAPCFEAIIMMAEETKLKLLVNETEFTYEKEIYRFINNVQKKFKWPNIQIFIKQSIPEHIGLGSKTTTLLAIGKAYATLCGEQVSSGEFANIAGRARTSGASVNLIEHGGFLVDGGHANPEDFQDNPQHYLLPSHFARDARKPPVLINIPFPLWPILLIVTNGIKLHGELELDWFKKVLPIPVEEAHRTAHHVLMNLVPAISEANYAAFCKALNTLTYTHYYKQNQIATHPKRIQRMFHEARKRSEIDAIGMSGFGPICFAFTRHPRKALEWCAQLKKAGAVQSYGFSSAQNFPCILEGTIGEKIYV